MRRTAPPLLERARLVAGWHLFEARVAAARADNEGERHALEEERKALEGTQAEAAWEQEEAALLAEASQQQAAEALARERQAQELEEAAGNREIAAEALQADLACQKGEVDRTRADLQYWPEEL